MFAVEVAPDGAEGVREGSGQEVVERLLLDGVDRFGDDLTVGYGIERAAAVDPDAADSLFSFPDSAPMCAEGAADGALLQFPVESRLVHMIIA